MLLILIQKLLHLQKGESIYDTVDALSLMGVDMCVLRHSESVIHELTQYIPQMIIYQWRRGVYLASNTRLT